MVRAGRDIAIETVAIVLDRQPQFVVPNVGRHADPARLGVLADVGEGLLRYAIERQGGFGLDRPRQGFEIGVAGDAELSAQHADQILDRGAKSQAIEIGRSQAPGGIVHPGAQLVD